MGDFNKLFFSGKLGKTPESRLLDSGSKVCKASVAVSEYQGKDREDLTTWLNLEVWGQNAEFLACYGKTGSTVVGTGRYRKTYYTDESGVQKEYSYIKIDSNDTLKIFDKKN